MIDAANRCLILTIPQIFVNEEIAACLVLGSGVECQLVLSFLNLIKHIDNDLQKDHFKSKDKEAVKEKQILDGTISLTKLGNQTAIKKLEKNSEISEDDSKGYHEDIQELTDKYIKKIDEIVKAREAVALQPSLSLCTQ